MPCTPMSAEVHRLALASVEVLRDLVECVAGLARGHDISDTITALSTH